MLQEIFDKVVNHLRKQNAKSVDPVTNTCLYRGPNGMKCAVGCIIPDKDYLPEMEGKTCKYSDIHSEKDGIVGRYLYKNNLPFNLLYELQLIHDEADVKYWEEEFRVLALEKGLNYTYPAHTDPIIQMELQNV